MFMCGRLKIVKYLLCVACFFRQSAGSQNMDDQQQCNKLSTDKVLLLEKRSLCFVFVSQLKTWDSANTHCQNLYAGGRLLEISDINIRSSILGATLRSHDSWIGLRLNSTQDKKENIRWTSGAPLTTSDFIKVRQGPGLCAAISPGDVTVNALECRRYLPSICEIDFTKIARRTKRNASNRSFEPPVINGIKMSSKKKPFSRSTIKADSHTERQCDDLTNERIQFGFSYEGYCYILVRQLEPFTAAADTCRNNYKGNLVYIPNTETESLIQNKLKEHGIKSRVWIGFWRKNSSSFAWISGGSVNYTGWAKGYPELYTTETNCLAACIEPKEKGNHNDGYHWKPYCCSEQSFIFCQIAQNTSSLASAGISSRRSPYSSTSPPVSILETTTKQSSSQISQTQNATIYYIIAAVVGAVLLAVFLIVLCWRLKRRRGRPKIEMMASSPEHCSTYISPEEINLKATTEQPGVKEEQALLHNEYDIANVGRVKPNNKKQGIVGDVSNYDHAFVTANNINGRGTSSPFEGVYDHAAIRSDVRTPGNFLDATYDRANFEAPSNFEGVYDCTQKISTKTPCGQKSDSCQLHARTEL